MKISGKNMKAVRKRKENKMKGGKKRRRKKRKEEVKALIRKIIEDVAEKKFLIKGFAHTRMEDIAEEAGMAAGTIYNYFESKEEILSSIIERKIFLLVNRIKAFRDAKKPIKDNLERFIVSYAEFFDENRTIFELIRRLSISPEWRMRSETIRALRKKYLEANKALLDIIETARKKKMIGDYEPRHVAAFFSGIIHSFSFMMLEDKKERKKSMKEKVPIMLKLFYEGIGYKGR